MHVYDCSMIIFHVMSFYIYKADPREILPCFSFRFLFLFFGIFQQTFLLCSSMRELGDTFFLFYFYFKCYQVEYVVEVLAA